MYKPFLSHKREDAPDMEVLHDELLMRGAGGWQDTRELRLGQRWMAALRPAIRKETGGFIWYGTRRSLSSKTIRRYEVPQALRRSRRRNGGAYPVVPLFVDLSPGQDADAIKRAFGPRKGQRLLDLNGVIRGDGEDLQNFSKRAARYYVKDLIREHSGDHLRVAITTGREPTGEHDLSLDWRCLVDEHGRLADANALATLVETLADIRQALQTKSDCPHITVEPHVRLPLAALIGWEWSRVRPLRLTVQQPSPAGMLTVHDILADARQWGAPDVTQLAGDGPVILAVSVGKPLGDAVQRYAMAANARQTRRVHVYLDDRPGHSLTPEDIASLAQWAVAQLAELNDRGVDKHLLLLGPASLAVRIGAAANGTGLTWMPFWDGGAGYTSGISIGR
jgi:hypothetical protein